MFIQTKFTASAAIATNGTQTFSYPNRPFPNASDVTTQGDFVKSFGHVAFAEGLQATLKSPKDFTLTFGNSSITFTYLGTTSIPASTAIAVELHTTGQNAQAPYGLVTAGAPGDQASQANSDAPLLTAISSRVQIGGFAYVNYGTPVTASATSVVNAAARTGASTLTTYSPAVVLDVARTLQYVSSNAGDTTQTVTIRGLDDYGVAMTETVTLNGTTIVHGLKAFKTAISDTTSATLAGNLSIGSDTKLGLPIFLPAAGFVVKDVLNSATATAGTYVAGDQTTPSATTGDVRGTYNPNSAPSTNTNTYESFYAIPDLTYLGATQFGG